MTQDFRDLAAYYAYLPQASRRPSGTGHRRIVESGAPMRNIAPCACMSWRPRAQSWQLLGSRGSRRSYLKAQLLAFASGARHNDISQQMRNIARRMTAAEIDAAAKYYGNQP